MNRSISHSDCISGQLLASTFGQIISALDVCNGPDSKGNYKAICPFHDDTNPSFSVHPKNGFTCFACNERGTIPQLRKRLRLDDGSVSSYEVGPHRKQLVRKVVEETVYDYEGFQVVRRDFVDGGKKIIQRRRDKVTGRWIYDLKGVERTLYRLSEVLMADYVIIAEGEKCAEAIRARLEECGRLGEWAATTNPGGAGAWQDEMAKPLTDKIVYICPDNDKPGRRLCKQIYRSLSGKSGAALVKVVELPNLPHKGDIVDFFESGGTIQDVITATEAAEGWKLPFWEEDQLEPELISDNSVVKRPVVASDAVYQGLAGQIVRAIEPYSEADPVAILASLLGGFGNMIGREAHWLVSGSETKHHANVFFAIIGKSAKARKGTALSNARQWLSAVDPLWYQQCVNSGLTSGEGLIYHVRDREVELKDGKESVRDPGVKDKRLMVTEEEFAQVLQTGHRKGNTLSSVIRSCWDKGDLSSMAKNSPMRATGAHVSMICHCTEFELKGLLSNQDLANGFANRFLWMYAERSKEIPLGKEIPHEVRQHLTEKLRASREQACLCGQVPFDDEAVETWIDLYHELAKDGYGLADQVTSRGEPQVRRLAMIYALFDGASSISSAHLKAAYALWQYNVDSVRYIFGSSTGSKDADTILQAVQDSGQDGLTQTEISDLLKHPPRERLSKAINLLNRLDLVYCEKREGKGRPTQVFFAKTSVRPSSGGQRE